MADRLPLRTRRMASDAYLDQVLPRDWDELDEYDRDRFIRRNIRDEFGELDWNFREVISMIDAHADLLENWGATGAGRADGE